MALSNLTNNQDKILDVDWDNKSILLINIDNLKKYLAENYNLSKSESLKCIESDGEISYLIKFVKFSEYGTNVTLQIPSNFSLKEANIVAYPIKSDKFSQDKLMKLRKNLDKFFQIAISQDSKDCVLNIFYKASFDYIDQNFKENLAIINAASEKNKSSLNIRPITSSILNEDVCQKKMFDENSWRRQKENSMG